MSDWKIGDLAVCVHAGELDGYWPDGRLVEGRSYEVRGLALSERSKVLLLVVDGVPRGAFEARFRKIRPDEHEDCEPEFVTLLESFKVPAPLSEEGVRP